MANAACKQVICLILALIRSGKLTKVDGVYMFYTQANRDVALSGYADQVNKVFDSVGEKGMTDEQADELMTVAKSISGV